MFQALIIIFCLSHFGNLVLAAESQGVSKYAIDAKLEGPDSPYTSFIVNQIRNWSPKDFNTISAGKNPVQLTAIETSGNPDYVGIKQVMSIDAPLERVEAVLDDVNHYKDIFPGYDDIHLISQDGNKSLVFWEQHIPLFFIPNVTYVVTYLTDKSSAVRKIYRYKLKESKKLNMNDGMIVIEQDPTAKIPALRTRYLEYDFFDANWGIVKTIAPGRIWKDSLEGVYLSDVAIKLQSEHPDWKAKQVVAESQKALDANPVDSIIKRKISFQLDPNK